MKWWILIHNRIPPGYELPAYAIVDNFSNAMNEKAVLPPENGYVTSRYMRATSAVDGHNVSRPDAGQHTLAEDTDPHGSAPTKNFVRHARLRLALVRHAWHECASGTLSIKAALGFRLADLAARQRHRLKNLFELECWFLVRPLGLTGAVARVPLIGVLPLLIHRFASTTGTWLAIGTWPILNGACAAVYNN